MAKIEMSFASDRDALAWIKKVFNDNDMAIDIAMKTDDGKIQHISAIDGDIVIIDDDLI